MTLDNASNMNVTKKEATNSKLWKLHIHLQYGNIKISTITAVSMWALKISVTNSVPRQPKVMPLNNS